MFKYLNVNEKCDLIFAEKFCITRMTHLDKIVTITDFSMKTYKLAKAHCINAVYAET